MTPLEEKELRMRVILLEQLVDAQSRQSIRAMRNKITDERLNYFFQQGIINRDLTLTPRGVSIFKEVKRWGITGAEINLGIIKLIIGRK